MGETRYTLRTYFRYTSWPIILAMLALMVFGVLAIRVYERSDPSVSGFAAKQAEFKHIRSAVFTADSASLVYAAGEKDKVAFAVIDGKPRKKYDEVTCLYQWDSPFHFTGPDAFSYIAVKDGAYYWVEERRVKKALKPR